LFVAVLASQAAPTSVAVAQGTNDIRNFRVTFESENQLHLTVDYTYSGDHGDNVWIVAGALNNGQPSDWIVSIPVRVQKGSGQTTVKLTYGYNDPPPSFTTDQVRFGMLVGDKTSLPLKTFSSKTFDYAKTWSIQALAQGANDIRGFRVSNESVDNVKFIVDYTYSGEYGDNVWIGASPLSRGQESKLFAYGPGDVQKGSGQATVTLTYGTYDPPPSYATDQVEFMMYVGGEYAFLSKTFDYAKKWSFREFVVPNKGYLSITSTPSGAGVLIDGIERGVTPFNAHYLDFGTYYIKLVKDGYEAYEEKVTLSKDNPRETIRVTLVESGTVIPGIGEVNKMWLAVVPVALGVLGFLLKIMRD
jgi:hypothetical protein